MKNQLIKSSIRADNALYKKPASIIVLMFIILCVNGQTVIKLTKSQGIYSVPCQINGKPSLFYFDTGASEVSLSDKFYNEATKEGILKASDLLPEIVNYQVANGDVHSGRHINLRELRIGNLRLNNIIATVVDDEKAPLLLGQSALEQFGSYTINNNTSTLTIEGNYKSNIDLALEAVKQKMAEQNINTGQSEKKSLVLQQQIQQSKIDILRDIKVASGLEFDVSSIELDKDNDNELTFKYDITNNSGIDYKSKALSQLYIFIDVFTKEGKIYSTSAVASQMLAGNTVNGQDLSVKLRNKLPMYFRIYGVVNGPLLSTLEN